MMDSLSEFLTKLLGSDPSGPGFIQILSAMAIAYFGGVLSSFTPCVYPMIPITVGVIGGLGPTTAHASRPWAKISLRASAYLGGMITVYALLGMIAGLTGKIFGSLTQTAGWYLGLGILMSLAALAMMEAIPFDPAQWAQEIKIRFRKLFGAHPHHHAIPQEAAEKETLWGAAGLGASSGILSSPCTTPVLTVILAFVAKSQSIGVGLALMVSFALGLGTLLLVISFFTGALQILPKSGRWMKTVKVLSGLILLAFGEYLIYRAGTYGSSR